MRGVRPLATICCALLASLAAADRVDAQQGATPRKQVINRPNAPPSVLSTAVKSGGFVYLSGALGTDPATRRLAEGGIQGQTRQTLENVKAALALAGGQMEDVVKCTVFLVNAADFQGMNQVYREFFPTEPPARTTVAVAALVLEGALIEIECMAAARG
jgi:2-iminobutanoate/2-iminopropanoate deaminase